MLIENQLFDNIIGGDGAPDIGHLKQITERLFPDQKTPCLDALVDDDELNLQSVFESSTFL